MLAEAGVPIEPLVDRDALLRELFPEAAAADRGRLDLAFSRLKLDLRVTADDVAGDPAAGPIASAFVAYERAIAELGGVDFDDLVVRSLGLLQADERILAGWRGRCARLLVDEAQDLDRTQLELALLLAAPATTCSSWATTTRRSTAGGSRTCDGFSAWRAPCRACDGSTSRRTTGARGPSWSARCASSSTTASGSRSGSVPGPIATGRLVLAPDAADDLVRVTRAMPDLARGRVDPGDPRPHEPRAAGRRRRGARPRDPVPCAGPAAPDRGRPDRRPARSGGRRRRWRRGAGSPLLALGRLRRTLREEAAASGEDWATTRRRGRPDAGRPGGLAARLGGAAAHARGAAVRRSRRAGSGWPSSGATTRR